MASQEGDGITKRAPYVDLVFGPQTLHRLPDMIRELRASGRSVVDVSFPEIEKFDHCPQPRAEGATAFVSIMEGCSKYCTFCVVPYTRGEEVSRPFESVMDGDPPASRDQGVREVNLLGQNVNAYRGPMDDGTLCDLGTLIYCVAEVRRHRTHPLHDLASGGIQRLADRGVSRRAASWRTICTCRCSPAPIASSSAMKRGYTALEYKQKIRKLRAVRPDISVSSDFIVGFPGETERDFEATMNLIADVGFDQSFSFIYSRRPGTPAASLPDDVTHEEKQQRLEILQDRASTSRRRPSASAWSARCSACWSSGRRDRRTRAARRPHREHALGELRRPETLINQFADVVITEAHAELPARPAGSRAGEPRQHQGRCVRDDLAARCACQRVAAVPSPLLSASIATRDLAFEPVDNARLANFVGPHG